MLPATWCGNWVGIQGLMEKTKALGLTANEPDAMSRRRSGGVHS